MKIRTFLVFVFSFLPLGSTTLVESRVDKVEGKIIFCSAELKSPDGKVTFVTANALFIQLDTQGKGAVDVDIEPRGHYMAARRYEISLRVLKNISRMSAANE